tara:strand:- start:2609 stop:2788 length:180 start_codon:yes stop_codon:yes gene_type:complete
MIHTLNFGYVRELAQNYHISEVQRMNLSCSKMKSVGKLKNDKSEDFKSETWAVLYPQVP